MTGNRRRNPALKTGSLKPLAAGKGFIAYGRFNEKNRLAVVLNVAEEELHLEIPVWEIGVSPDGVMERLMLTADDTYNSGRLSFPVKDGILTVDMPPESSMLFVEIKEEE